jgi:hypothetical protein
LPATHLTPAGAVALLQSTMPATPNSARSSNIAYMVDILQVFYADTGRGALHGAQKATLDLLTSSFVAVLTGPQVLKSAWIREGLKKDDKKVLHRTAICWT